MNFFQLDECYNAARVATACNAGGKCSVRRWPPHLSGVKDHVWIPEVLSADAPVVTIDFEIMFEEQNRRALPSKNSGVIVVKPEHPTPGFGSKQASAIIQMFKSIFPEWHCTDWSNVYVELTGSFAYVCSFADEMLNNGTPIKYEDGDFVTLFKFAMISARSSGFSLETERT